MCRCQKIRGTVIAIVLAFFFVNLLCFVYNRDTKWIWREEGATTGVYAPGHVIIQTDEGCGIAKVDENGYVNPSSNLSEDYVVCVGNSMTNAVQVMPNERYVGLLNNMLGGTNDNIRAYCVAHGGTGLSDIICGFKALVDEFPDSKSIVIQIQSVESAEVYKKSIKQRTFSQQSKPEYLLQNESVKDKMVGFCKDWLPLITYFVNYQFPRINMIDDAVFFQAGDSIFYSIDESERSLLEGQDEGLNQSLDDVFSLIRSEYSGQIILLYHPNMKLGYYGDIVFDGDENTVNTLKSVCNDNDIVFCDMTALFEEAYINDHIVPYGFNNTAFGYGHLNDQGHRLIAEALYPLILNNKEDEK